MSVRSLLLNMLMSNACKIVVNKPTVFAADHLRIFQSKSMPVIALVFAEYQSRGAPFTFDQRHMEYYRLKVLADIMSEQIDPPKKSTC